MIHGREKQPDQGDSAEMEKVARSPRRKKPEKVVRGGYRTTTKAGGAPDEEGDDSE